MAKERRQGDRHAHRSRAIRWLAVAAIALACAFWGLAIGTSLAGLYLVPPRSGLVGPVVALAWGLLAALVAAVLGLVVALRLGPHALRWVAVAALGALLLGLALSAYRYQQVQQANRDPDSAYAGIAPFEASLDQLVIEDPYLRVKMEIDTAERRLTSTGPGPDHRVCTGIVRAQRLRDLAEALAALDAPEGRAARRACEDAAGEPHRRLLWQFDDSAARGSLDLAPACAKMPAIARAIAAMDRASLSLSSVDCD